MLSRVRQARENVQAIRGDTQEQGEVGDCGREDKQVSILVQTDEDTDKPGLCAIPQLATQKSGAVQEEARSLNSSSWESR